MELYRRVCLWFWNDSFWLPQNVTWNDIKPTEENAYANFSDLCYTIPLAFVLIAIRKIFERLVFERIGRFLGIKDNRKQKAPDNALLEAAFKENGLVQHKQIQGLAKQLDWSERQVERWLRYRSIQNKPTVLDKYSECSWRATYYLSIFFYGLWVLWDKPWLWDSRECWNNYPKHVVTNDVWWYYMIEIAFYSSLAISQFIMDVKRKDFWEMFIHHFVTISLLSFSWSINMTRIGTLVMVVHDVADPILELAKMAKYINNQFLCNILFVLFMLTWVISRLTVYPYVVLYSTMYEAGEILHSGQNTYEAFPANVMFNALLILLQILHFIWTFFIFRVLFRAATVGKLVRDERSEESCTISDSSDKESLKKTK